MPTVSLGQYQLVSNTLSLAIAAMLASFSQGYPGEVATERG